MANTSEIKSRIDSVTETKKVTDAMYMISSVKRQKAKREVLNTEPYFRALEKEISKLIKFIPETNNRYFHSPLPEKRLHFRHGILLITSDKGLAGSYNHAAIKIAEEYMGRHPETRLFIMGEYGKQYFDAKKIPFERNFDYVIGLPTVWEARKICFDLLEYFDDGRLDEINIICTDYSPGRLGECKKTCLLPLDKSRFYNHPEIDSSSSTEMEFWPDADTVLSGIVPSYLTGFIYSSLVDSYCSEQEARMTAMSAASKNAEEMLKKLKSQYNSLRQAAITREMIEIGSGAKALKEKRKTK